jgi:hypothetical protein
MLEKNLKSEYGIFVDNSFDLSVSDLGDRRIQHFQFGKVNGITVIGGGASGRILLNALSWVLFDAESDIFIVDNQNHPIMRLSHDGLRCLVGCSNKRGSTSDRLNEPSIFAFDIYENIYVTDHKNN